MGIFQQFPYSNFHEMNLDQIIKIMRQMQDEWEETKTEWASLKDFVENYFNNLDLDAEVMTAMQKMVASGELATLINPTISNEVGTWLAANITPTTPPIDKSLTVDDAAADAFVSGARLDMLAFNAEESGDIVVRNIWNGHYWSTTDGTIGDSASWMCSPDLIRVNPGDLFVSEIGQNISVTLFGADRVYLNDYLTVRPADDSNYIFQTIPNGCYFVGVSTTYDATIDAIVMRKIGKANDIEAPYSNGDDYIFIDGGIYDTDGLWTSSASFMCVILSVNAGDKFTCNAQYAQNACCWDADNNVLGGATYVDHEYWERVFTMPADTVKVAFNIQKTHYHGGATDYSTVYYKLTKNKKVLAIGDSITWLNNRNGYDGSNLFWGWQKSLEAAGYEVDSLGYNGACVADDGVHSSIYDYIVNGSVSVSGYDVIVILAGTNDNLYSIPIGSPLNTYYKTVFDSSEFIEAYAGLLRYIRENNTAAKIVVCTLIKSEAAIRNYNNAINYVDAIRQLADVYGCYVCDLFKTMNVSPSTNNFTPYFYDNTHPNKLGMKRIGKQITHAVEDC